MGGNVERAHAGLLAVVGVLLVATVAGMAALWPASPEPLTADDDAVDEFEDLVDGEILEVEGYVEEPDPDVGLTGAMLRIDVRILEGPDAGEVVEVQVPREGFPRVSPGDVVALDHAGAPGGEDQYYIADFQRLPTLMWLLGLFVAAVLVISRWHGLRSLVGLALSLLIIVQFVVPAILDGASPPAVALVGAVAVMIVTLYLTHGVRPMTTAAVVGTSAALAVTVALGSFFISRGRITGFASDDAVFARFAVDGALDLQGLVLAGLIIAALGVLDDVTISQSSTVFALHDTDPRLGWSSLFRRAMVVGRDHIASVVNTLFLAYAGASLALLVLFSTGGLRVGEIVNSEVLAEEIVKTVVGSLGLILAVPFTTALAATVAIGRGNGPDDPGGTPASPPPHTEPAGDAAGASDDELDDEARAARAWAAYLRRVEEDRSSPS